jgi:NAD(P)H-flavin reductase
VLTRLIEKRPETRSAATLRFDLGGQRFDYMTGMAIDIDPHQFAALSEAVAQREGARGTPERSRGFSLCSHPLEQGWIEITIKMEAGGLLTPYLVRELRDGDAVEVQGPYGLYFLPDALDPGIECLLHVAAGSGAAPNRGMIRYALARGLSVRHLLVYQNRSEEEIIYRAELDRVDPAKVKVTHVLSRPGAGWKGRSGYISFELLKEEMEGFADPSRTMAFVCGPNKPRPDRPPFVDGLIGNKRRNEPGLLGRLGLPFDRIKSERW